MTCYEVRCVNSEKQESSIKEVLNVDNDQDAVECFRHKKYSYVPKHFNELWKCNYENNKLVEYTILCSCTYKKGNLYAIKGRMGFKLLRDIEPEQFDSVLENISLNKYEAALLQKKFLPDKYTFNNMDIWKRTVAAEFSKIKFLIETKNVFTIFSHPASILLNKTEKVTFGNLVIDLADGWNLMPKQLPEQKHWTTIDVIRHMKTGDYQLENQNWMAKHWMFSSKYKLPKEGEIIAWKESYPTAINELATDIRKMFPEHRVEDEEYAVWEHEKEFGERYICYISNLLKEDVLEDKINELIEKYKNKQLIVSFSLEKDMIDNSENYVGTFSSRWANEK